MKDWIKRSFTALMLACLMVMEPVLDLAATTVNLPGDGGLTLEKEITFTEEEIREILDETGGQGIELDKEALPYPDFMQEDIGELLEEQLEDSVLILQEDRGDDFTVLAAVTLSEDEDEEGEPCFADQVKIIGLNGNLEQDVSMEVHVLGDRMHVLQGNVEKYQILGQLEGYDEEILDEDLIVDEEIIDEDLIITESPSDAEEEDDSEEKDRHTVSQASGEDALEKSSHNVPVLYAASASEIDEDEEEHIFYKATGSDAVKLLYGNFVIEKYRGGVTGD